MIKHLQILLALLLFSLPCLSQAENNGNRKAAFAWGASLTSSVDLSGHDRSTIGMDAYFGLKTATVQMLGVGAGLNVPVSSSLHTLPVYVIARTNFTNQRTLCFADVRAGISVNDVSENVKQTAAYGSVGVGINLASSAKFRSHLILAYTYFEGKNYTENEMLMKVPSLHMATLRLGITF